MKLEKLASIFIFIELYTGFAHMSFIPDKTRRLLLANNYLNMSRWADIFDIL